MRTGLLSSQNQQPEPNTPDSQARTRTPDISETDAGGIPQYSQANLPQASYSDVSYSLANEQEAICSELAAGNSSPMSIQESTQNSGNENQTDTAEANDNGENAEDSQSADNASDGASGATTSESEDEEQQTDENKQKEGENEEDSSAKQSEGAGGKSSSKQDASPVMPLVAAIPRMARIQTPYVPSPPLQAIQRREEIIKRTGSPPELHHAQIRQTAENVTQAARDAQRQMIIRVGYIARNTRISIEDMADEVWKATQSAIGSINGSIDKAIDKINQSAKDEIAHVKKKHVIEGENVQQTRDNTVLQIYKELTDKSKKIKEAEAVADALYEQKVPTAEQLVKSVPEQGRVGRIALKNAQGEFSDEATLSDQGTMVEGATEEQQADFHIVDDAKSFVDDYLVETVQNRAGPYFNIERYLLARSRPHLEGHAENQQTSLETLAQKSAERMISPANKAQFMIMVLGLTTPVSEHHDKDQTQSLDSEKKRNDEELKSLSRANAQAVFTLRQKRDMATKYSNLDLRKQLTGNLRKQGKKGRDGIREQAQQAEIGLNSSTALMAEDYVDLIRRLDRLIEADKFLNAGQLIPQMMAARASLIQMLAQHENAADKQAQLTKDSSQDIKLKQLEALDKSTASAIKSIGDVVTRSRFDMSMFSSMVTGSMSDGARAGMKEARAYAEGMTSGILSTNEKIRGPAMDRIDNIAAGFFNSAISGTESAQFKALSKFVKRMEGRGDDSSQGGPLGRVIVSSYSKLQTNADTLHRITRGPDPTTAIATAAIPLVGGIVAGVYLYKTDPDDNQVVKILGEMPWPGVPAVGDMFMKRGHGFLKSRIRRKITEPQRTTALGLFSESAKERGEARAYGIENSTGWFDLNREARDALGQGMSEEEHSALATFSPEKLASAKNTITEDLESHELEIALAHLENNHERAIAAQTLEALEKGRKDSSWGWIFSAQDAQQNSDRARVNAIENMDTLLRQHQERHFSYVSKDALQESRNSMFKEVASLTDADEVSVEAGQQALINEATKSHYASVISFGVNPVVPAGIPVTSNINIINTSDQAEQFIRDAVNNGGDSDAAKASRAVFELTQAENQSELSESTQMHLTKAFENQKLSSLQQDLDDLDRRIAVETNPDKRDELITQRESKQTAFNTEQTKHRKHLLLVLQRTDPDAAARLTPKQAENVMARRVGNLFARQGGIFTPDNSNYATYGQQMITRGRASLEAGAVLATEGWGTHEDLLLHNYKGRSKEELKTARAWWSDNYHEDMDTAMGINNPWRENGVGNWFSNFGAETSGDLAMKLERHALGEAKTDLEFVANANLRHHQDRVRGTGLLSSMEGSSAQKHLDGDREKLAQLIIDEAERRQPGSTAHIRYPTQIFLRDGTINSSIRAITFEDGEFVGDRTLFASMAQSIHDSADSYQAEIALQESILTTTIALAALLATVVAMLIPGVNVVAVGIAAAIISGITTVAVKAGMRGQRYGWEEAATDVAMTAIEAGSAGMGAALGKVSAFARLGKVGGAVAREALSGAITASAQVAINDATWKDGFAQGLKNIASGALRQAAVQGISAGVSEAITGKLNKSFSGKLDSDALEKTQSAASRIGPYRAAAITDATAEFFGSAAGESVGLTIDHAQGKFKGNFGDALKQVGLTAFRDMAKGALRGSVNTFNKQRYRDLLQSARQQDNITESDLKAIRKAGISAGLLETSHDIEHVRSEIEVGRKALLFLPPELRKQVNGFDAENLQTLKQAIDNGGFSSQAELNKFVLSAYENNPGFDAFAFYREFKAGISLRKASQRSHDELTSSMSAADREILAAMTDDSLKAFETLVEAGPGANEQMRTALYTELLKADPTLTRDAFNGLVKRALRKQYEKDLFSRLEIQENLDFVHDDFDMRNTLSFISPHALLELKILQQQGGVIPPATLNKILREAYNRNPYLDLEKIRVTMEQVVALPSPPRISAEQMTEFRSHLAAALPENMKAIAGDVPIMVMRNSEFEAFARSESGQAVTIILHGRPVVIIREGAAPRVLREEGLHVLQSKDPTWADRVGALDEATLSHWDDLPIAQQMLLYKNKLEIELDAQHRLIGALESDIKRSNDPQQKARLNNELALLRATLDNLHSRFTEVKSISRLQMLEIAAGERARPQWLEQPARLFHKRKKNSTIDTEPIDDNDEPLSREFILQYLTEGQDQKTARVLIEQVKTLPTGDLHRLADLSSSPQHMRGILDHTLKSTDPKQHFADVITTLSRLPSAHADGIVRQLGGFTRNADYKRYMDTLLKLGQLKLSDQRFNQLIQLTMGTGVKINQLDAGHLRMVAELVLPKNATTPPRLDGSELQRLLEISNGTDPALTRKILQVCNDAGSAKSVLHNLETITQSIEPASIKDVLLFVTENRNLKDVKQVIDDLTSLRKNTPTDTTFKNFFDMLVLTDSGKKNMLSRLVDLTGILDVDARKAFATFIERTDQSKHVEVIKTFCELHEKTLQHIQVDLFPGKKGQLLSLIIEMASTRTQWKIFRDQTVIFLQTLHELHQSSGLRKIQIKTADDKTQEIDGIEAILKHISQTKDRTDLSDSDRSEILEQLAADITAATKQLYTDPVGDEKPTLRSIDARKDILTKQVINLKTGEGVLAGKDTWSAHLANESATWKSMQAGDTSKHFAALLKAVKPDWDNDRDNGQLGALKRLQPWFEKLARLHNLDPNSTKPADIKKLQGLLEQLLDPVANIKRKERFDEVVRALREATVSKSLGNRETSEQERTDLKHDILSKVGLTEENLASARPQDGHVIKQHLEKLVKRYQEYQEAVRLAESIGASTAGLKQNITEAIGEIGLTVHMLSKQKDMILAMPFGKGTGFDQVWIKTVNGKPDGKITEVVISEAKGPGAELGNPAKGPQMSLTWVKNTLKSMAYSGDLATQDLARRLIEATSLPKGRKPPLYRGIVVRAEECSSGDPNAFKMGDKYFKPIDVTTPDTGGDGYDFKGITLSGP